MQLIGWQREDGSGLVDDYDFFERPLAKPVLFSFRTRRMQVQPHGGAYSLKFTLSGRETYFFGRRSLPLVPGEMLFVERGRVYASDIREDTDSLSLFLPDAWVAETAASLRDAGKSLLEPPDPAAPGAMPAVPLRICPRASGSLEHLVDCIHADDPARAEEVAVTLVAEALVGTAAVADLRSRLTAIRASTRDELLTRLRRAHERIVDRSGLGIDLDDLSRIACLSRFHFLRLFKQAYGSTPLRLAARLRMERAVALAAAGDMAGALAAGGFRSAAGFHRARRRSTAATPDR